MWESCKRDKNKVLNKIIEDIIDMYSIVNCYEIPNGSIRSASIAKVPISICSIAKIHVEIRFVTIMVRDETKSFHINDLNVQFIEKVQNTC